MGLAYHDVALLAKAKKNNIRFDKILTIGHQTLYVSQKKIEHLSKFYDINIGTAKFSYEEYADNFLKSFLGAKDVKSLDFSDYEGSEIIHDMNKPIGANYYEKFDVVIDGGSLEHIFNFPVAIENCMKMVKKGGSFFIFSMANNHFGHGFYQFSPELFFRILQQTNGFEIKDIIVVEHPFSGPELSTRVKCYSVTDPAFLKRRVSLISKKPVTIMIHAIRTELKPIFSSPPMQSDYLTMYENKNKQLENNFIKTHLKNLLKKIFFHLPLQSRNYILGIRELHTNTFSNKQFFKKVRLF